MDINKVISTELKKIFPECIFIVEKYDGFWHCSWTDGPTEEQMEHYIIFNYPTMTLEPYYDSIQLSEGFEYFQKNKVLSIRLVRYLSPERYHYVTSKIEGYKNHSVVHHEFSRYENEMIKNGMIPGYQLNLKGTYYHNRVTAGDNPTVLSATELIKRHEQLKYHNAKDKLMLSTLMRIYGINRLTEILESEDCSIEELFETAAYSIYSDESRS